MKSTLFFKQSLGTLLFFSLIFFAAGTIKYWQGLTYTAIGLIMITLNYTVFALDKDLLAERSKPGKGVKKWDKVILALSFIGTITMFIVAGLDSGRYHWSSILHWSLYGIGILLTITGQLLFLIAQKQNRFFSSTVRIQRERGHTVCENGLYSIVRHPAYLGSTLQTIAFPLFFGSLWSIIPVSFSLFLLILRTYLEDITLRQELSGYDEYIKKTRYKLIPWVW